MHPSEGTKTPDQLKTFLVQEGMPEDLAEATANQFRGRIQHTLDITVAINNQKFRLKKPYDKTGMVKVHRIQS